jgi:hypothetical protein
MLRKLFKKITLITLITSVALTMTMGGNSASSGKVLYKDKKGGKIVLVKSNSSYKYRNSKQQNAIEPRWAWNPNQVRYVGKSYTRGTAVVIATFKNQYSSVQNEFNYEVNKTWNCELSTSGSFDIKAVEASIGVKIAYTYTTKKLYKIYIPAYKNMNLWSAPQGNKYTWQYWTSNYTNSGYTKAGSGSYKHYTSEIVTPVYY